MSKNQNVLNGNDSLRKEGIGGIVVATPSVFNLGYKALGKAMSLIKNYEPSSNELNVSSGSIHFDGNEIFWKIESSKTCNISVSSETTQVLFIYMKNDRI